MLGQTVQAIAVGLLAHAISKNAHGQITGFLVMSGVGVGLSVGRVPSRNYKGAPVSLTQ
jgi:hypothetical protein